MERIDNLLPDAGKITDGSSVNKKRENQPDNAQNSFDLYGETCRYCGRKLGAHSVWSITRGCAPRSRRLERHALGIARSGPFDPPVSPVEAHVPHDVPAALDRSLSMGAKPHQPVTNRGTEGFTTASVVDPLREHPRRAVQPAIRAHARSALAD